MLAAERLVRLIPSSVTISLLPLNRSGCTAAPGLASAFQPRRFVKVTLRDGRGVAPQMGLISNRQRQEEQHASCRAAAWRRGLGPAAQILALAGIDGVFKGELTLIRAKQSLQGSIRRAEV